MRSRLLLAATAAVMFFMGPALGQDKLTIGTEGAYPPFNTIGPDGSLSGFDIDIAKALCAEMKVECEFVTQDWDGIIPGLQAGKYDAIIASMSITEERKSQVLFTNKYYTTPLSLVAPKDSVLSGTDPAAYSGKVIGAQAGTTQAEYAEKAYGAVGAEVKQYPTHEDAIVDMNNGRVDAVISDKFVLMTWLEADGKACCKMVGDIAGTETEAGIALRLGEEALRDRFNAALDALVKNGTYKQIQGKYFSFDIY